MQSDSENLAKAQFSASAELCEHLTATASRLDRSRLVADYLRGLDPSAVEIAARLLRAVVMAKGLDAAYTPGGRSCRPARTRRSTGRVRRERGRLARRHHACVAKCGRAARAPRQIITSCAKPLRRHSDELQTSSLYPCGMALRFARIARVRDDKRAGEADTVDTLRRLLGERPT